MKLFEMPEVHIMKFALEDVITTSAVVPNPTEEQFCI